MGKIVYLSKAVVTGRRYRALRMRPPLVRDLLAIDKSLRTDAEREVALFAALCGVERQVIEGLSLRDYGRLQEMYLGFLGQNV